MNKLTSREDYDLLFKDRNIYQYTNNMIYEFYIRSGDKYQVVFDEGKDKIILSDIVLYYTDNSKKTLQDIIYNIYPSIYEEFSSDSKFDMDNILLNQIKPYFIDDKYTFVNTIYKDLKIGEYITFTKEMMLDLIEKTERSFNVTPKFEKPTPIIKKQQFVDIKNLNLSLPTKELVSYINTLKKYNNDYLKIEYGLKPKDKNKDEDNFKNTIYTSIKLEDILFVYDKRKDGASFKEITDELNTYRFDKFNIDCNIDDLNEDYDIDDKDKKKLVNLKNKINNIYYDYKLIEEIYYNNEDDIYQTNIKKINKYLNDINQIFMTKIKKKLIYYSLIISHRTVRNYEKIAKYYINDKKYVQLI